MNGNRFLRHAIFVVTLSLGQITAPSAWGDALQGERIENSGEGVVVASHVWDVAPSVDSQIKTLHFIEGQMVKKGDLLVEFYEAFSLLELELAEANLAVGKIRLGQAQDDLNRMTELQKRDAVSMAQFRDAGFEFAAAEAQIGILQIQVEKAATILKMKKIFAPFDGQITASNYHENANVDSIEGKAIATVHKLDPVHVHVRIEMDKALESIRRSGATMAEVRDRLRIELVVPGGETYPHTGTIASSAFIFDLDTQTSKVLVAFPNPEAFLRPGMKVTLTSYLNDEGN